MSHVVTVHTHRGWEIVRLRSPQLEVDVVPGKGGDILAARWRALDLNLLWTTPWGLRERGSAPTAGDSLTTAMEQYPGGWQTVFPNGGEPTREGGVEHGFHGEAWLAPWDHSVVEQGDRSVVEMTTRLVRTPFTLTKRVHLDGSRLTVEETAENVGGTSQQVMWSHHPAFGAPFVSGSCQVETAATKVVVDAAGTSTGDLEAGASGTWPRVPGRSGALVDLRSVPAEGAGVDRFAYLTDMDRGWAAITNPGLGLTAMLEWDVAVFPHAWYWLEANATADFPWYRAAYVLAIEPAASYPGHGIAAVRDTTDTLVTFEPGQRRTTRITLTVSPA